VAEAMVVDARSDSVVLSKPKITTVPQRYDPLFSDGKYSVFWAGNGYSVRRLKDSHVVAGPVATIALAERALAQLYPKPMGGRVL
jgi:hypothetical protein